MSVMSANPELQEKLRNFIEECGSQTKAAKALGKSAATLSTYLCTRYIVEVDPAAVLCRYNALGTEDHAVLVCVFQSRQSVGDLLLGVLPGRLYAPAGEHFICMVVMVMFMVMIVVMAAAGAVLVMFVVVMVVMMFMFLMVVVMIVAAAGAVLVVFVVVMVVMVFMFLMVMIVVVVMIVCSGFCQQFL